MQLGTGASQRPFSAGCLSHHRSQVEFKALPLARSTVSGEADPRTSSILFLFEEFVPLEYRQQLTTGNKRKLVSLFSPAKSKQWKPAATLNGRPYVIGHVPRTATYGEVDFENMLRGGNSSTTKVLSLNNGAVKSVVTGLPPPSLGSQSGTPLAKTFALGSGVQRGDTPRPGAAPRSDSPAVGAAGSLASPLGGKKSRFRLIPSVTSPNARKSVIPPSEYDAVDFETRLASYSDDELNGSNGNGTPTKGERRRSKDDAWVDILVANHGRRMNNQAAELRVPRGRGLKGGRSDPELASMEVAAALAAVQGKVPADEDEGDDIEPMRMSGVPGHSAETDTLEYTPSVTDTGGGETAEYDTEEGEISPSAPRRVGYFDLHPERRLTQPGSDDEEEDPRVAMGRSSHETGTDDMTDYPPLSAGPTQSVAMSDDFEVMEEQSPGLPMPEYELNSATPAAPSKKDSMVIPPTMVSPDKSPATPAKPVSGKTAALIEMYRERERGGSPSIAAPVARPPALPPKSKDRDISPSVTPPSHTNTPPQATILEPPAPAFEPRSDSPSRYVHGAPLHNVVEEPEEED